MTWLPTAISGIGALSGLLKGGDNGYGDAKRAADLQYDKLGDIGNTYGSQVNENQGYYSTDNPAYRKSVMDYADILGQDRRTDQNYASRVNDAIGTYGQDTQRAAADAAASGARRGIDTSDNFSSMGPTTQAYFKNKYATGALTAELQANKSMQDEYQNNQARRVDLLGGLANQDYGRINNALSGQENNARYLGGVYGNEADKIGAANDQQSGAFMDGLTGFAGQLGEQFLGPKAPKIGGTGTPQSIYDNTNTYDTTAYPPIKKPSSYQLGAPQFSTNNY